MAAVEQGSERAQARLLATLIAAIFMISLDSRVVTPLLPTIATALHTSVTATGSLVTAYVLPYGLFQLVYGPLADRFGKVRVIAVTMIFFSVGMAACGAPRSLLTIAVLRFLTGVAAAAVFPLTLAYVGDTVPYARRQATIAILASSSAAATAFSTAVGGLIATVVSWRLVFPVFGAAAGIVTLLLLTRIGTEVRVAAVATRPRFGATYLAALRAPLMIVLLLTVFSEGALYNGAFTYLGGFLHDRFGLGALLIGLLLAMAGLAQLGTARVLARLVRRLGERRLVLLGGVLMGGSYLVTVLVPRWPLFVLPIVCAGTGFVLCHSTLQTRATEAFPLARGTAVALFAFALFLGNGLGTALTGAAIAVAGYGLTLTGSGTLLCLFALAAAGRLFPTRHATAHDSVPVPSESP